ncbi:MAG: hypothetical protein WAV16_03755 [Candidatus Moraniibacteriota bacterium]
MRKFFFAVLMMLVTSFPSIVKSDGNISVGTFSVDGKKLGGMELSPGSYGSIHQETRINGLAGSKSPEQIVEQEYDEDSDIKIPPVQIITPKEISKGGFASTMAKKLLKESGQSE